MQLKSLQYLASMQLKSPQYLASIAIKNCKEWKKITHINYVDKKKQYCVKTNRDARISRQGHLNSHYNCIPYVQKVTQNNRI